VPYDAAKDVRKWRIGILLWPVIFIEFLLIKIDEIIGFKFALFDGFWLRRHRAAQSQGQGEIPGTIPIAQFD